jgi:hypothetical protein
MTGRRNGNRIRGPQSALTDFLSVSVLPCPLALSGCC